MSEAVWLAVVAAFSTCFGVMVTKGIDAFIRFRKSEGEMDSDTRRDLRQRIMHLEAVVEALQKENSELNRQLGRLEAQIEILSGRCDHLDNEHHTDPPSTAP